MKSLWAIAYREFRIRLINPIFPLWDLLVPVIYLVVFGDAVDRWLGSGGGPSYPSFFLGGVLSMVTFGVAFNSSYAFFEDVQSGIFHEQLTYPFPRRYLLLGKLVFNASLAALGMFMCLIAGLLVLGISVQWAGLPALVGLVVLGTAAWYLLLAWVALGAGGFNAYHTTTSALYLLLMFVSNLFYPTDRLPDWIRWIAWANPITWQTDLTRWCLYGSGEASQLWLELGGLGLFAAVSLWLCDRKLNGAFE